MSERPAPKKLCLVCAVRPRRARSATCSPRCQKRWAKFIGTRFAGAERDE